MNINLAYFAYLSLGGFVAGMLIVGLKTVKDNADNFVKISNTTIFAAFVGAAIFPLITFINDQTKTNGPALFMYPIGLAISMLWFYAEDAQQNISSEKLNDKLLGSVHIAGVYILTFMGIGIAVIKTFW